MENITTVSSIIDEDEGLISATIPPRWAYNLELVLMLIVFLVGIPGNAVIIIVQAKASNKTSTDYLVLTMACYELLCSSVNAAMKIFEDINVLWLLVSSKFVCKFAHVCYYLAQYGSAQTLGMIAVDRCIKTIFPLSTWYGNTQAVIVSIIILLISATLCAPRAVTFTMMKSTGNCAFTLKNQLLSKFFGIAGSTLSIVIFILLTLSYVLIAISLKRRHIKKVQQRMSKNISNADFSTVTGSLESGTNDTAVEVSNESNSKTSTTKSGKATANKSKMLTLDGRNLNRLTVLMFLISLIYVGTNSILWFLFMTNPFILGKPMLYLAFSIPMLNCIANPLLFFSMSSRFRSNVKTLFRCR